VGAAVQEVGWHNDHGGGIKCVVGLSGSWSLAQSMGIYPCNTLVLGLGCKVDIKPCLFPECEGQGMPSPRLLLQKSEEMSLVEHMSAVPPLALPASDDCSHWASQGKTLDKPV